MNKIRVMIVDDQQIIRDGLKMLIELEEEILINCCASNGKESIELLEKGEEVDVILMDIRMPEMNGVEATKIIRNKFPQIKIIILTTFDDDELIFSSLRNGASTYMLKDISSDEIISSIKSIYQGKSILPSSIAAKLLNASTKKVYQESLTKREVEIARLVAKGLSNKKISERIFITEGTVKNHITKILSKLSLNHRTQIALYVIENKDIF